MFLKPFKTLVVGVDFSDYSKIVVEQAFVLAKRWKTKIVLVHALTEPRSDFSSPIFMYAPTPSVKKMKESLKKFYGLNKSSVRLVVGYDTPARLIRSVAKDYPSSLIMAGYKGHTKLSEFLLGSTARNLSLGTAGPVWIHRGQKAIEPNRILVPHDLSRQAHRAINLCENLKMLHPLSYDVFFVRERPIPVLDYASYTRAEEYMVKEAQKRIVNLLSDYPKIVFHSTTGDVTEKIVEKTKEFDLILLSHRKHRGFLSSSETAELIGASQVPLLVI